MPWTTEITIKNNTNSRFKCKIKKGQVFENKKVGTGFQNVVAAREYFFEIAPHSKETFQIEVWCLNERLRPPSGHLNLTNYMVNKNFLDQKELWKNMNLK